MTPKLFSILPALLLAACSASAPVADNTAAPATAEARDGTVPLTIRSGGRVHRFDVEVALTAQQQAQGLMLRKSLPDDGGMVFPMDPPRTASFWMKDTVIPLDMLFIRTDGSIAMIAADRKPYSREPASAGVPVAAVLELRGGRAAELGVQDGDQVQWGNCAAPGAKGDAGRKLARFCP